MTVAVGRKRGRARVRKTISHNYAFLLAAYLQTQPSSSSSSSSSTTILAPAESFCPTRYLIVRTNRGNPIPLARIYQSCCCCSRATRHPPTPSTCRALPAAVSPVSNRIFPKHVHRRRRRHSIFIPIVSCIRIYVLLYFSFYTLLGTYNSTNTIYKYYCTYLSTTVFQLLFFFFFFIHFFFFFFLPFIHLYSSH